jgi:hypothetical protein
VFYREDDGTVPVLEWLDTLSPKAQDKCQVKIERLQELGHELRIGLQGVNYRILYFFHEKVAAALAHGLLKERAVSTRDLNEALRRKHKFERAPQRHTYQEA